MKLTNIKPMNNDWKSNPTLLKDVIASKGVGLHNLMVAMGAGKTHAVKSLLTEGNQFKVEKDITYWLISPYKVQRDDYEQVGAIFTKEIPFGFTQSAYTYINTVLAGIRDLDTLLETESLDKLVSVVAAMVARANPNMKVILDEYDTLLVQAKMDSHTVMVGEQKVTTADYSEMFIKFLNALSLHLPVIKLSATKESLDTCEVVTLGTSVRIPVVNNIVMPDQSHAVVANRVLQLIDDATMNGEPVLVYKAHYETEYYGVMAKLAAMGISTLLVTRNERLTTTCDKVSKVMSYAHEHFNFFKVEGSESPLHASMRANVLVVENEDGAKLPELLKEYQVVFINLGHSRVISVFKDDLGEQVDSMTVISIGSKLDGHMVQADGRSREVSVNAYNVLYGNIPATEKMNYEGDTGMDYLMSISPCQYEYGTTEINLEWEPRVSGGYKKGDRVSSKTLAKQQALQEFLSNNPNGSYPLYCSMVPVELQYNRNKFGANKKAI